MVSIRAASLSLSTSIALLAGLLAATPAGAQTNAPAERFTANAVNISEIGTPGATPVDIVVERWSSDAERERLISTLLDKGPKAFLEALQEARRVGFIRTPTSLGYEMRLAWQEPGEDGGRRIFLMTDRPIGFAEAVNQPRTINYPITVIELQMKNDGEGEGKMFVATRVTGDKRRKTINIEDYASQPVMLKSVKSTKTPG